MERRDFLKVVTSVSVSQTLLLTLKTSAMSRRPAIADGEVDWAEGGVQAPRSIRPEKVTVSNNGRNLVVDVEGPPGRFVLLLYKLEVEKGKPRIFIHQDDRIPAPGHLTLVVDMADALDMDIPFMVVTSAKSTYDNENLGTDWFTIRIESLRPSASKIPPPFQTDPSGEHQKVIRYAVSPDIAKRKFAPLKTDFRK